MKIPILFAADPPPTIDQLPDYAPGSRLLGGDMALIVGAILLVILGVILWVVFIRGPRKHPDENHRPNLQSKTKPAVTVTEDGRERHRKKRRLRRRDHRQRNPTLDQTGGLPPPRDPQETPSV